MYLTTIKEDCSSSKGSVIAETLLNNIKRFPNNPYCSEHQAKAIAETAYAYNIYLFTY